MALMKSTLADAVDAAFSEITTLADEVRETVDNATEAMQATTRIQTLDETASTLEENADAPEIPGVIAALEVSYILETCKTRAQRRDFAAGILDNVLSFVGEWCEANPDHGELETVHQFTSDLESAKDNWEGVDFPGFGRSG